MRIAYAMIALALGLTSCGGGGGGGTTGPGDGQCGMFEVGARPLGNTHFVCGAAGAGTIRVMSELNQFWGGSVVACSCQSDALNAFCFRNGAVLPQDPGYIYYDASFLNDIDTASGGNPVAGDWFMAHEYGHNVQIVLGLTRVGKVNELQADCLAGYFLASRVCTGTTSQQSVVNALSLACQIGDPNVSPWWQPGAHGTCPERVAAVEQGFGSYNAGALPGQACP